MALQNGKGISAELRRYEVLRLKVAGVSERRIAKQLGFVRKNPSPAWGKVGIM